MLRDHHREDVHLLLEFRRVDVAGHDDRLGGGGGRHLGEGHEQGGVQRIGVIHRHAVQMEDRVAVMVLVPSARTGADAAAPQVAGIQVLGQGRSGRLRAADEGEIGETLDLVVLDHIIGDAAAERPSLDLAVLRKGRQGLCWHNS